MEAVEVKGLSDSTAVDEVSGIEAEELAVEPSLVVTAKASASAGELVFN